MTNPQWPSADPGRASVWSDEWLNDSKETSKWEAGLYLGIGVGLVLGIILSIFPLNIMPIIVGLGIGAFIALVLGLTAHSQLTWLGFGLTYLTTGSLFFILSHLLASLMG